MSAHSNSPLTSPSGPRRLSPQTKPISAGSTSNRDEGSDTKRGRQSSARFQVKELGRGTWPDFERMVEKHNGVWGGCWDTWFHMTPSLRNNCSESNKGNRESLSEPTKPPSLLASIGPNVVGCCRSEPLPDLPAGMLGNGR